MQATAVEDRNKELIEIAKKLIARSQQAAQPWEDLGRREGAQWVRDEATPQEIRYVISAEHDGLWDGEDGSLTLSQFLGTDQGNHDAIGDDLYRDAWSRGFISGVIDEYASVQPHMAEAYFINAE